MISGSARVVGQSHTDTLVAAAPYVANGDEKR